jgi:hypothetical protein
VNVEVLLDQVEDGLRALRAEYRELRAFALFTDPDGFPASTWSQGDTGGRTSTVVDRDADGEGDTPPDATVRAVLAIVEGRSPQRVALADVEDRIVELRRAIDDARSRAQRAYRPTPRLDPEPVKVDTAKWCAHHAQLAPPMFEPVSTRAVGSGLCRFCDEWAKAHEAGELVEGLPGLPPREVLEHRARGKRVTEAFLVGWVRDQKRGVKRGKKNRRRRAA